MQKHKLDKALVEFLPAALEIQAAPPPTGARSILWALVALLFLAIIWACLGKVDIVAVAQGKISPKQQVKVIQPIAAGLVKAIHVVEGQKVIKGQLLLELEPALNQAESKRLTHQLTSLKQQRQRKQQLLTLIKQGATAVTTSDGSYQQEGGFADAYLLQSELSLFNNTLGMLDAEINRNQAEQQWVEQANIQRLQAATESVKQNKAAQRADFIKTIYIELAELHQQILGLEQELVKSHFLQQQSKLFAPVSGTVEKLVVTTIGGVVSAAQELLTLVPLEDELIADVGLLNKDIGFTYPGQMVEVKIESFPFTRYGIIAGEVIDVSTDAIEHEQLGLIFPVKVALKQQSINVNGRIVPLSAGMTVMAEIKTGKRQIIDFLLSPIKKHANEGARER
jgi:hemolysin D